MTALTIATLRAAGVPPAGQDRPAGPGPVVLEWIIDGAKQAVAAADTVDLFELPALAGMIIDAAAVTIITPGTATGTIAVQIGGTSVTGLTAWAADAAAGTKLVKLATAANTVVNTSSASYVRVLQSTAALGVGKYRLRVYGTVLEAAPV